MDDKIEAPTECTVFAEANDDGEADFCLHEASKDIALVPIQYSLSTVGIEPVFLCPPPSLEWGKPISDGGWVTTSEIVATIKARPEDFVVREIGGAPRRDCDGLNCSQSSKQSHLGSRAGIEWARQPRVADLTDPETLPPLPTRDTNTNGKRYNCTIDKEKGGKNTGDGDEIREMVGISQSVSKKQRTSSNGATASDETGSEAKIDDKEESKLENIAKNIGRKHFDTVETRMQNGQDLDLEEKEEILDTDAETEANVECASSAKHAIQLLLSTCHEAEEISSPSLMEKIVHMHDQTLKQLSLGNKGDSCNGELKACERVKDDPKADAVWVPPLSNRIRVKLPDDLEKDGQIRGKGGNRGLFHRCLKLAFPLLCSQTVKKVGHSDVNDGLPCESNDDTEKVDHQESITLWIRVEPDLSFFELVPFLERPLEDLMSLYCFRNRGCVASDEDFKLGSEAKFGKRGREGKARGRGSRNHTGGRGGSGGGGGGGIDVEGRGSIGGHVLLHLRQEVDRDGRRKVHHHIVDACKELETGTRSDVPLATPTQSEVPQVDGLGIKTTTAIVVKWSWQAQRVAIARKRKMCTDNPHAPNLFESKRELPRIDSCASVTNTLCVIRKRQVEHLTALQNLATAMRCRPSDIGLAGIKDMCAVTYQFCTFRNITPRRVQIANTHLRKRGMEVGNYERVDWLLNTGDLVGNRFEIILRDLRRVKKRQGSFRAAKESSAFEQNNICGQSENEMFDEEMSIPCDSAHIDAMVGRVCSTGFINFYGEQRVGCAGREQEVGVRAFQVGKAMLRQKFDEAVDLIMRGRLRGRGGGLVESEEVRRVRKVWVESGGDPVETFKALPKGCAMARERTILKGLKRYGRDRPLDALRCLQHSVRMFWINAYQSFVWNKMASERIRRFGAQVVPGDLYMSDPSDGRNVKVVTKETSGVELAQLVLPLPGYDVQYPENEVGDSFKNVLEADGVEFMKGAPPEATARGAYRTLVANASNLSWEVVCEDTEKTKHDQVTTCKVAFDIGSGCYATMFLRELLFTTVSR